MIHSQFPCLTQKIKGKQLFFFSDFDGTLAPIRRDPAKVVLSARVRRILEALILRMPVAIISGRPLTYLHKVINMPEIVLAGNHGLEIDLPNIARLPVQSFRHPEALACKKRIHQLARRLQQACKEIKGTLIEDKGLSLTFHYRAVLSALHETAFKTFDEIIKPFQDKGLLRVSRGKMCLEVRPNIDWGKAEAMAWILDVYQSSRTKISFFPVYMGDDETDRAAVALAYKKGISLFKGSPNGTRATYFVESHEEIIRFMRPFMTAS